MGELVFLGVLALLFGLLYLPTYNFEISNLDTSGGPAMFPRAVIIFTLIFIAVRFIMVLKTKEKKDFVFLELFRGMRLFFFASIVIFIIALKYLGYLVSTIAFLLVTLNFLYYKTRDNMGSVKSIIIRNVLAIMLVFALRYFFVEIVNVILPTGTLF